MTYLTPEDIEKIKHDLAHGCTYSYRWPGHRECMQMVIDAIEQRAGLVADNERLRDINSRAYELLTGNDVGDPTPEQWNKAWEAAQQVAEWKEKAELLEWLMQYSESRFSQWMAQYKAGTMMGHMALIDALRAAREASDE